jgi:mono/diheme cytochrome c family protein
VTGADIPAAASPAPGASPGTSPGLAGGSTDPKAIIAAAGCLGCHSLDGQGGKIAPDLTHVGARRSTDSIRKKILDPMSSIAKGYEKLAGVMPKSFGTMLTGAQLEALVQYLGAHR